MKFSFYCNCICLGVCVSAVIRGDLTAFPFIIGTLMFCAIVIQVVHWGRAK